MQEISEGLSRELKFHSQSNAEKVVKFFFNIGTSITFIF